MSKEHYKYIDGTGYFDEEYVLSREREIDRLNKILKALEKGINGNIAELEEYQLSKDRIDEDKEILRFLQELKGSDRQ